MYDEDDENLIEDEFEEDGVGASDEEAGFGEPEGYNSSPAPQPKKTPSSEQSSEENLPSNSNGQIPPGRQVSTNTSDQNGQKVTTNTIYTNNQQNPDAQSGGTANQPPGNAQTPAQKASTDPNKATSQREGFKPGGGEALRPKSAGTFAGTGNGKVDAAKAILKNGIPTSKEGVEQVANEVGGKAVNALARGAMIASGAGALASGVVGNLAEKAAKKLMPLQKKLAPAMGIILVVVFVGLFAILGQTAGMASSFGSGILGKTESQPVSASDSSDMANVSTVLGAEIIGDAKNYLFKQGDPRWGSKSYGCGGTTLRSGGCGCTSAAMVLKKYGASITPEDACAYSLANGHRICGAGTSPSLFKPLAAKYGLKTSIVDWEAGKKLLAQGKPLIKNFGGLPFARGGHYVVLVGIQGNIVYVNDPGPRNTRQVTEQDVLSHKRPGGFYYIHP